MTYTIPSYTVRPGSVYQPNPISAGDFPVDFLASNVVGCWSTRQLLSTGGGNIIRGRDATTNEEDFTGSGYPAGVVTLASGGDAFCPQLYDQSGNTNHATQTVAASQPKLVDTGSLIVDASGRPVMEFDGLGDRLTASNVLSSDISTVSVFFRVKIETITDVNPRCFSVYLTAANKMEVHFLADYKLRSYVVSGGVIQANGPTSDAALNDGSYHTVACTSELNNFKMYIDGVLQAIKDTSGVLDLKSGSSVAIGNAQSPQNHSLNGFMNDITIFDKVLTQAEVTQLHNALA
jgi:hypothetical protein